MIGALAVSSLASAEDPKNLPIDRPKDAQVLFEVDSPASKLVPFAAKLMTGDHDFFSPAPKKIPIHTWLGTVNIDCKELADLLRPIKELHIAAFTEDPKDGPIGHYEQEFTEQGMHRVAVIGGDDALLLMRDPSAKGRYVAVMQQGNRVTVVRTDGMPDLGVLGQVALEKLTEAAARVRDKIHL